MWCSRRAPVALLAALALAACGGDSGSGGATPDDVDQRSEATATEREVAAFRAPADSVLTPAQVEGFLRTTLLQFDLIRNEAPELRRRIAAMEERGNRGGVVAGLRNLADAGRFAVHYGDLIGGSFVRSARTVGQNPAEMEWVRERMNDVSAFLILRPMHQAALQSAAMMRQQAGSYRGMPGFDEAAIRQMIDQADAMEAEARREMQSAGAVTANVAVLRRTRSAVTDEMWAAIAFVGGTAGLWAWGGLSDPDDAEAQRQLDEWRGIYTDALENRVTPGMEADATDDGDSGAGDGVADEA
jgi:hypothetical protein